MSGAGEAAETVGAVLADLAEVAGLLPVPSDRAEETARIMDRLAGEISQAAGMLRAAAVSLPRIDGSIPAGSDERLASWAGSTNAARMCLLCGWRVRIRVRPSASAPGHICACGHCRPGA